MASADKGVPSPMARLATIRTPRDLSLGGRGLTRGGVAKRKFLPVVPSGTSTDANVSVNHDEPDVAPQPSKKPRRSDGHKRQWEERGNQNHRGRGWGRYSGNLIQTTSTLEATLREWSLDAKKEKILLHSFRGPRSNDHYVSNNTVADEPLEDFEILTEETTLKDEFFMLSIPKNGEAVATMNPLALPPKQKYQDAVSKNQTNSHIAEDKKGLHSNKIYFVTLPNKLPGQPAKSSENQPASKGAQPPSLTSVMMEENVEKRGSLATFSEGLIGKLRFRKSGKVELVMGGNVFTCRGGTSKGYQEAAMLDTRMTPPKFVNFGKVEHWLDFSPDLISLVLNEYKGMNINDQEVTR